jgi:hypothetical protein
VRCGRLWICEFVRVVWLRICREKFVDNLWDGQGFSSFFIETRIMTVRCYGLGLLAHRGACCHRAGILSNMTRAMGKKAAAARGSGKGSNRLKASGRRDCSLALSVAAGARPARERTRREGQPQRQERWQLGHRASTTCSQARGGSRG